MYYEQGIKNSVRRIAHKMGVEFFTLKKLPFGINYLNDAVNMGALSDPTVIFDIGANVGQTSLSLRKIFKRSEIYAFEPVRSTYLELKKT